jgi:hypothetical protein
MAFGTPKCERRRIDVLALGTTGNKAKPNARSYAWHERAGV